jgi:hypothetical protein
VKPFIDLHFYIYKLSSGDNKPPDIEGFAQAVEAARQTPLYPTLIDLLCHLKHFIAPARSNSLPLV